MNTEKLVRLVLADAPEVERVAETFRHLPEEVALDILALTLANRRTPSGESWTRERLSEVVHWQTEVELPIEVVNAVTVLNNLLEAGRHEVSINNNTISVLPKRPTFMIPRRAAARGKNGEVVITLAVGGKEVAVDSFSELVRALGEEPRHEHGLKQAAPIARAKGATIRIAGRPSKTVVEFAKANSDVVELL